MARLTEIVHPAMLAQVRYFHGLGLRARLLSLPVMVGLVLGLLWRQLGSVSEWVRVVQTEVVLWVPPLRDLTQQALAQRLRTLPAELFARVLRGVLPVLHTRWRDRRRPLPPVVAWVQARYAAVLIADGSTLDGLVRKIGLLQDTAKAPLAGRMLTLLDLSTRLPRGGSGTKPTRRPTTPASGTGCSPLFPPVPWWCSTWDSPTAPASPA
ncbi:MAG: hypothetical protein WBQ37_05585 [Candidatus Competibacter sp.]